MSTLVEPVKLIQAIQNFLSELDKHYLVRRNAHTRNELVQLVHDGTNWSQILLRDLVLTKHVLWQWSDTGLRGPWVDLRLRIADLTLPQTKRRRRGHFVTTAGGALTTATVVNAMRIRVPHR